MVGEEGEEPQARRVSHELLKRLETVLGNEVSVLFCRSYVISLTHCSLAYAELFIVLATVVKEFGARMKLHDTDARQVAITGDHFFAKYASRRGVVVMIDP